jgi:hypothetical protein
VSTEAGVPAFVIQVGGEIVDESVLVDDELAGHIAAAFGFWLSADQIHWHAEDAPPRVTRRCHYCDPCANPVRLCIDGREYRRRRQARKKRRR